MSDFPSRSFDDWKTAYPDVPDAGPRPTRHPRRVHLEVVKYGISRGACGRVGVPLRTTNPDEVTCPECKR